MVDKLEQNITKGRKKALLIAGLPLLALIAWVILALYKRDGMVALVILLGTAVLLTLNLLMLGGKSQWIGIWGAITFILGLFSVLAAFSVLEDSHAASPVPIIALFYLGVFLTGGALFVTFDPDVKAYLSTKRYREKNYDVTKLIDEIGSNESTK